MASEGQKLASTGVAFPALDALVARAGGGQASATQIPVQQLSGVYRFTTVATAGDSAILPPAPSGNQSSGVTIINAGAASMNVYPPVGSQINNAGANVAFALAAGKSANFYSINGVWHAVLSA